MLRLSKKADYALIAMKHLALRPDQAASSAREIAEQYDIPVELMAKVLQRLAREGLLASHQGTRGGYQLSRPPSDISVADVIQAVDGPLTVTACSTEEENCDQYSKCSVRDPLWKIKERILVALQTCSITELAAEAAEPALISISRPILQTVNRSNCLRVEPVEPHLSRFARDDSGRSARARRDAAVFHRAFRQCVEPQPSVRLEGRQSRRAGARAGRGAHRRAVPRRRLHERCDRVEQPRHQRGCGARARRPPPHRHCFARSTAPFSIRAAQWSATDFASRISRSIAKGGSIWTGCATQLASDTLLVSAMSANNEIGVLHPLAEIAEIAHAQGALFHCDAAQSAGLVPLNIKELGVDLVSLSAHKMYGPKGIGALYVAKRDPAIDLEALIDGGGHERGYRSGTLNVPAIVGFGKAAELCRESADADAARLRALRDRLWTALSALDGIHVNGPMEPRLPNNLNVRVDDVHGESLLKAIAADVAVSSGAACATASAEPSHVLRAMGLSDEQARASIRFGLGRFTTEPEIDAAAEIVVKTVRHLRR